MVVKYCPRKDEYVNEFGTKSIKGWDNGAFRIENILRKEELDWKYVYLCRRDNNIGELVWRFDVTLSDMVIDTVELSLITSTFKTGAVIVTLLGDNTCITVDKEDVFKTKNLRGETIVTLKVELNGGEGDIAWQHAQIFRVPIDDLHSEETYPFKLTITLCNKLNT